MGGRLSGPVFLVFALAFGLGGESITLVDKLLELGRVDGGMQDDGDPVAAIHVVGGEEARCGDGVGDEIGVEFEINDVDGGIGGVGV